MLSTSNFSGPRACITWFSKKKEDVDRQIQDWHNEAIVVLSNSKRLVKLDTKYEVKKSFNNSPKKSRKKQGNKRKERLKELWRLREVNYKRDFAHRLNSFSLCIPGHNHSGNHSLYLYNFHHSGKVDQHSHQCLRYNKKEDVDRQMQNWYKETIVVL